MTLEPGNDEVNHYQVLITHTLIQKLFKYTLTLLHTYPILYR